MSDGDGRFFDALYRGVADSEELGRALDLLQQMFEGRGVVLVAVDAQDPTATFISTAGWLKENLQLYLREYAHIDPAPARFIGIPAGTATTTNRLFSSEELKDGRFFNEFFRPAGMVETLAGNLYSDHGRFSFVGIMRGEDREPFDDDDILRLERLMPHVTRALQLRGTFSQIETRSRGLQATVDRMRAGLALLGQNGAALFVNATMRGIAQRGDGFALDRSGRPLLLDIDARKRFDTLIGEVTEGGIGGILKVQRTSGLPDYIVLVAPSRASPARSELEQQGRANAIVLVHDPNCGISCASDFVERALGLPSSAARLAAALAGNDDLKSFAKAEGITIHTARFHLRTALARTGTRTQTELVRLTVRLLSDFTLGDSKSTS